ncbi:histidinol dehydrogenase [Flavobacteriaceae bacterium]|jgi:histidinol dehydrogenase|nr:histidinol dehydrogenase [Flavobacteriaceae bacterium]
MIKINNPTREEWPSVIARPTQQLEDIEATVSEIFQDVRNNGDLAVKKYTAIFDGVELDDMYVSKKERELAETNLSDNFKRAILKAKQNIEIFHVSQKSNSKIIETVIGVKCWQEKKPIQKIGLYIPGGTAPLFSTVLMLAIPAKIAGCQDIVLCSPPNKNGKIADEIIYAAQLCGCTKILKVGGIQAIAGLTFGTKQIHKVYKIFGPGNQFVTVAKQLSTKYGMAIDMPAGPSELLIVADDSANPKYVASDLLSQAEHGVDSQVILIANSINFINRVEKEVYLQLARLPRRDIARKSIDNSKLIFCNDMDTSLDLINTYGPEHFIICTENNDFYVNGIINAGSVFIGDYSPESAGDYATGTNHTLPTNGFSKAYSGVNLDSFMKSITFQEISKQGLINIGETIEIMAEAEGLEAHKNAVTMRLNDLKL